MLVLNKPTGLTSFQAIGACKRACSTSRVGHAGTLDKFAQGILLVFLNEACRLVPYFVGLDKTYIATIRFGIETDTLDPEGRVVAEAPVPALADIRAILPQFEGTIEQVPPQFSAVHIDGERAYKLARGGKNPVMKPREVTVSGIELLEWNSPNLRLRIDCSSGTYIRSLARDIGHASGSAAYLHELTRSRVGVFGSDDEKDPNLKVWTPGEEIDEEVLLQGRRLAESIPGTRMLEINPLRYADFRNGKALSVDWFPAFADYGNGQKESESAKPNLVIMHEDKIAGIVRQGSETLEYSVVFPEPY